MSMLIPSISAKCLSFMPQFVLQELGEKGLSRIFDAAGLPLRFLESRDGYIPQQAAATFIRETARTLGHDQLGLLLSPFISVSEYGAWGAYVLSAPTLGIALSRVLKVMPYHANKDRASLRCDGQTVWFSYRFAVYDQKSHSSIAHVSLAAMLDIMMQYLGGRWVPAQVLINIPKPVEAELIEKKYRCPVQFDSDELAIVFSVEELKAKNKAPWLFAKTTVHDIARERGGGPPDGLVEMVREILFQQIIDNDMGLDNAARMLDMGPRRLQRALEREGTSFRQLSNRATMQRATELLGLPGETVSSVAAELGYSSPANFSRAFKTETGQPPGLLLGK